MFKVAHDRMNIFHHLSRETNIFARHEPCQVLGRSTYCNGHKRTELLVYLETKAKLPSASLQAGRSLVRFSAVSMEFFIDVILLATLESWGGSSH